MSEVLKNCPFCDGPVRLEEMTVSYHCEFKDAIEDAKFMCLKCNTIFTIGERLINTRQSADRAIIKKFNTRKPIEDMLEQLHNAGGCDGTTDYDKGWDDAMAAAERIVRGDVA